MRLTRNDVHIFIPDDRPLEEALTRITHLGIGAHHDDLEIMAAHGVLECFHREGRSFGGVTCTDGRGSPRSGPYQGVTDDDMVQIRVHEQDKAAVLGDYGIMIQLHHPSGDVKSPGFADLRNDLATVLDATRPEVVYTHNPADKHDTHIGVIVSVVQAIHALPAEHRPRKLLGCEVWRGLDWLSDQDKTVLPITHHENIVHALVGVFDSQIAGGKRYDLATLGRARANATFHQSHEIDDSSLAWFAMDLSSLIHGSPEDLLPLVEQHLEGFANDVRTRLANRMGL